MKQIKENVYNAQKDIRAFAGDKDTMTNVKVKKSTVSSKLKNNILTCGTPMTLKGEVNETTPDGLLFNDLDFNGIADGETVTASVMIAGFVDKARVKEYIGKEVPETVITALKGKIQFI